MNNEGPIADPKLSEIFGRITIALKQALTYEPPGAIVEVLLPDTYRARFEMMLPAGRSLDPETPSSFMDLRIVWTELDRVYLRISRDADHRLIAIEGSLT